MYGGKAISNQCVFRFIMNGVCSFKRFNLNRELIPNCWGGYRENTFANIQLSFRNKKLFGNG